MPVNVLYDTGTSMSCMEKRFVDMLPIKPKLISCDRYIAGMEGESLKGVGECFIQLHIGKRVLRDRVVCHQKPEHKYILGQVLHTGYTSLVLGTQLQVNIISP